MSLIFVADCNNFSKKYLSNTPKYQLLEKKLQQITLKNSLIVSIVQGFLLKNSNEKHNLKIGNVRKRSETLENEVYDGLARRRRRKNWVFLGISARKLSIIPPPCL